MTVPIFVSPGSQVPLVTKTLVILKFFILHSDCTCGCLLFDGLMGSVRLANILCSCKAIHSLVGEVFWPSFLLREIHKVK